MVKRGLEFFYFEIQRVPSEIVDVLPSQFSHSGQIFFHRAAATLKGLAESKKNIGCFSPPLISQKYFNLKLTIFLLNPSYE